MLKLSTSFFLFLLVFHRSFHLLPFTFSLAVFPWRLKEFQKRSLHCLGYTIDADETRNIQTVFAVPLSCDGCVKSVSDALYKLGGITKVEGNLKDQLISVEGSAAPSQIVAAIQETGKDAILRGSGASNSKLSLRRIQGLVPVGFRRPL